MKASSQPNYLATVVLPIITLVLGYLGSLLTEWFRDNRVSEREKRILEEERKQIIEDRRAAFQRETLLALSNELSPFSDLGTRVYFHFRQHGAGNLAIDSELSKDFQNSMQKISVYRQRILDEELRQEIEVMQRSGMNMLFAKQKAIMEEEDKKMSSTFLKVNDRLGFLLRELY